MPEQAFIDFHVPFVLWHEFNQFLVFVGVGNQFKGQYASLEVNEL
jgi:hypothetical protein